MRHRPKDGLDQVGTKARQRIGLSSLKGMSSGCTHLRSRVAGRIGGFADCNAFDIFAQPYDAIR